jgi:DNA-binding NtrC family response regulator
MEYSAQLSEPHPGGGVHGSQKARDEVERRTIVAALCRNRGYISCAASAIKMSRPTLHGLWTKDNQDVSEFR